MDTTPTRHRRATVAATCGLAACVAAGATPSVPVPAGPPSSALEDLAFLAGCWSEGAEGLHEQFTGPTENLILGTSRFIRGGNVVEFEFHRIGLREGRPTLTPYPGGEASVSFAADTLSPGYVVWANREHDFPQRIVYDGRQEGALTAAIEGPRDGETVRLSWRMTRADCAG